MPDSGIDYSDAPTLTEDFWKTAERGRVYKPIKQPVTARLDDDVLAWLKSKGKGYQARMNATLRREMLVDAQSRRHARSACHRMTTLCSPGVTRHAVAGRHT